MEGTEQIVIRRGSSVKCLKQDTDDTEFEGVVTYVYEDKQHVDVRGGFLDLLMRVNWPIKFIEVLS